MANALAQDAAKYMPPYAEPSEYAFPKELLPPESCAIC